MTEKRSKQSMTDIVRKNPWVLSTFVFGILAVVLFINALGGAGIVSGEDVGAKFVDLVNSQGQTQIEFVSAEEFGSGLYKLIVLAPDQTGALSETPLHATIDGKYIVQGLFPLEEVDDSSTKPSTQQAPANANVPKSDKPEVELFIWSYCPYGVSAQGPLAKVASLFKDTADFSAVLYYDGHGAYETQQNKIQACIQEVDKDKYWDYAAGFVNEIYPKCGSSKDIECDKAEAISLMDLLGIDSAKVMSCVETQGADLVKKYSDRAKELGVTSSPTLVINGVKASPSGRTEDAFKDSVCGAFNSAPDECSAQLSSTAATTTGSC